MHFRVWTSDFNFYLSSERNLSDKNGPQLDRSMGGNGERIKEKESSPGYLKIIWKAKLGSDFSSAVFLTQPIVVKLHDLANNTIRRYK